MQSLSVRASIEVAQGLSDALKEFRPEIIGGAEEGDDVAVHERDTDLVAIVNALERHVRERQPSRVELDGRSPVIPSE
jgi:hypothetical protein